MCGVHGFLVGSRAPISGRIDTANGAGHERVMDRVGKIFVVGVVALMVGLVAAVAVMRERDVAAVEIDGPHGVAGHRARR